MGCAWIAAACAWTAAADVADGREAPWRAAEKLRLAKQKLELAFAGPTVDFNSLNFELLSAALKLMQEVAENVNRVMHAGYVKVLRDEDGNVEYELSAEDEWAVEEYTMKYVFVLADLIPLVFASPPELASALQNERGHPLLRRQRILATLRVSWFTMLTNQSCWSIPFFGALAALSRRLTELEQTEHSTDSHTGAAEERDPYRQHLQSLLEQPWGERPAGIHLQVQSEPLLSWEQTRWKAFRKACSWLATARSRASVEVAERHFRSFHANSLRSILFSTAQWPVFDLLHRLARRPRLDDDLSLEDEDARQGAESEESTWPAGSVEAGQQRLSPALVLEYYRLFHVVTSLFSLFRLHWWVSHGTLIGALRDGGLSRHADDCEVDLPEKEVEILQSPAMLARLSRNGYELSYDPRGRCFKVWPGGSARADAREAQLVDQSWWLPQQRVGTPSLDIYLVQTPEDGRAERMYISNDVFHCNELSCQQYWNRWELQSFYEVPFGLTVARVPSGAASYLERVYGWDWNITVRPHGWASQHGEGFEAKEVASLHKRAAEPFGPLPHVL